MKTRLYKQLTRRRTVRMDTMVQYCSGVRRHSARSAGSDVATVKRCNVKNLSFTFSGMARESSHGGGEIALLPSCGCKTEELQRLP
jgi:hypothetical protein